MTVPPAGRQRPVALPDEAIALEITPPPRDQEGPLRPHFFRDSSAGAGKPDDKQQDPHATTRQVGA